MAFDKFSVFAIGLMASNAVLAAVTVTTPEEIVLLAVNDQEVNAGIFRTAKNEYKVDPGQVSFSVRYQQYFKHADGEHDILKSGVVTISAPNLIDGQKYSLIPVNVPRDFDDAKKYAEQPTVAIYDQNKKLVVQQTGANNESKSWLTGGVFGRAFDLTSSKKPAGNQPAAVYGAGTTVPVQNVAVTPTVVAPVNNSNSTVNRAQGADQQLIQIWQGASKAERQRFMSWLAEQ
ncbi:hypothetical protein EC844_11739 [Acinetobacter calcoaceticus]|uniref:DUF2057 domain-containing protein n=1 Tax=Acinetobacter calcoaceticus TaxID=471 RepID=A0A4R1XQB0_ACICA|nr:hypothetical protein EC844_11739 [Acinetobacter calcoaceticus]